MLMKKIFIPLIVVALFFGALMPIPGAYSQTKSYYSGDVVFYNDHVVIASTNMGSLEIFKQRAGGDIVKFATVKSYDKRFGTTRDFNDVMLRIEGNSLYAYAVSGYTLYKYDISNLYQANRLAEVSNASWDWYGSLFTVDGNVATVGSKGVKVWNKDLKTIDGYNIINTGNNAYNVTPAKSDKFLFNIANGKISIFDREARKNLSDVPLTFKWGSDSYKRAIYNDRNDNSVYVVDDEAVKKINFSGDIIKSFSHTGPLGYDVVASIDGQYIYFSDGIGIVKLRKYDLSEVTYVYTAPLSTGTGISWAMGLKTVWDGQSEKVIVFNGSNILVLDSNLKPVKADTAKQAFVVATVEADYPAVYEPLGLGIDKNRATSGSQVVINGQGFGQGETLNINFVGTTYSYSAQADQQGRFTQEIIVPDLKTQRIDIKVNGLASNLSYNLGFSIE